MQDNEDGVENEDDRNLCHICYEIENPDGDDIFEEVIERFSGIPRAKVATESKAIKLKVGDNIQLEDMDGEVVSIEAGSVRIHEKGTKRTNDLWIPLADLQTKKCVVLKARSNTKSVVIKPPVEPGHKFSTQGGRSKKRPFREA
jgi:hypothetical protein